MKAKSIGHEIPTVCFPPRSLMAHIREHLMSLRGHTESMAKYGIKWDLEESDLFSVREDLRSFLEEIGFRMDYFTRLEDFFYYRLRHTCILHCIMKQESEALFIKIHLHFAETRDHTVYFTRNMFALLRSIKEALDYMNIGTLHLLKI